MMLIHKPVEPKQDTDLL